MAKVKISALTAAAASDALTIPCNEGGVTKKVSTGAANGLPYLGADAKIPQAQMPATGTLVNINDQTGTTYTTVLSDANTLVRCNNASAITLTVPPNSTAAYPIGTEILVSQAGAGRVTVAAGAGVTINSSLSLATRTQHSLLSLIKVATNTWLLSGDMQ